MLTCIDVKFIFDSVRLGLSSSANILQIADVALRVVILLFLPLVGRICADLGPDFSLFVKNTKFSGITELIMTINM